MVSGLDEHVPVNEDIQQFTQEAVNKHYGEIEGFTFKEEARYSSDRRALVRQGFKGTDFVSDEYPNGIPDVLLNYEGHKTEEGVLDQRINIYKSWDVVHGHPNLVTITSGDGKSAYGYWCTANPASELPFRVPFNAEVFRSMGRGFYLDLTDTDQMKEAIDTSLDVGSEYRPVVTLNLGSEEYPEAEISCDDNDRLMVHALGYLADTRLNHVAYPERHLYDLHTDGKAVIPDGHNMHGGFPEFTQDLVEATQELHELTGRNLAVYSQFGNEAASSHDSDNSMYKVYEVLDTSAKPFGRRDSNNVFNAYTVVISTLDGPLCRKEINQSQVIKHSPDSIAVESHDKDDTQQVLAPGCKISDVIEGSPVDFIMADIKGEVPQSQWVAEMNDKYELVEPIVEDKGLEAPVLKTSKSVDKSVADKGMSL